MGRQPIRYLGKSEKADLRLGVAFSVRLKYPWLANHE